MNYHRIYKNDFVNGEGVRTTLFVSGCDHGCKGCYNKSTWSPDSGQPFTEEHVKEILDSMEPDHIAGLSLTGGDPLYHSNLIPILGLVKSVRQRYGNTKNIWMWTGYTLEELKKGAASLDKDMIKRLYLVGEVDVLIDGKFEQDKHDPELAFRGSTNQIIHKFTEF